ncbi:bestrophin-like domain [Streptantibioticus cattleyicolor]|uniref:DUF4239 domain-containing protein n=1 Tax=Streptantibioticus cattleyicolor (strain ATCC 35852 / DSM 46488 / JCM 4925 / NBRC 14057 / NRRL 8057) TaxID=1003195 RepID=F8JNI9_STREN|nr:DUF4239 domain-containing protein [Streptantibioticus cattleyicolor]AEW99042.1 hypothetical protein SCATT_p08490 [Streptantibioticus cattleyicolor NRRL 8057 = DSM 46488]CCB71909.1 conserved membrane protein of unknown function [Streptantibioticus cattleyicolor NRRL 8057 = DSM 46488]
MYLVSFAATLGGVVFAAVLGRLLGRGQRATAGEYNGQALSLIGGVLLSSFILLTGFQVAGSWSALSTARARTYDEARALTDVYWAAGGLAAPDRDRLRGLLKNYTRQVERREFPALAAGHTSPQAWQALDAVRGALDTAPATTPARQSAKSAAQSNLATVYQTRTDRAAQVKAGMPLITWIALLVAGAFLIAFPAVLGLTASVRNLVALCFVGAAVAFAVCLTAQLNHAFQPPYAVRPTAYLFAEARFRQIDG